MPKSLYFIHISESAKNMFSFATPIPEIHKEIWLYEKGGVIKHINEQAIVKI